MSRRSLEVWRIDGDNIQKNCLFYLIKKRSTANVQPVETTTDYRQRPWAGNVITNVAPHEGRANEEADGSTDTHYQT